MEILSAIAVRIGRNQIIKRDRKKGRKKLLS
jgi:hypothetical protein